MKDYKNLEDKELCTLAADQDDLAAFLDVGYSRKQALEVVTGIAWKTLSNYANHLVGTPIDKPFREAAA